MRPFFYLANQDKLKMLLSKKERNLLYLFFLLVFTYSFNTSCKKKNNVEVELYSKDSIMAIFDTISNNSLDLSQKKQLLATTLKKIKNVTNDSLKTKYYSKTSLNYLKLNDSLKFRETNQQTILLSKKLKDSIVLAEAYWDLGYFMKENLYKDSSYYYFSNAQKIYQKLNKKLESGRLLYSMALIQSELGDYLGSENNTIKAIEVFKPLENNKRLFNCYNNLGSITNSLGAYDRSLSYFETANEYLNKVPNSHMSRLMTINNIGNTYLDLKNYKKANEAFSKVIKYDSLKFKNERLYTKALNSLGQTKLELKDYNLLPGLFEEALNTDKESDNISGMSISSFGLAEYYLTQNDTLNSIFYAKQAKKYSEESENNERLLLSLNLLTEIDKKNASIYAKEYFKLNTEFKQKERELRDKFSRIRFETDEFIERNELLASQNQLLFREKQLWTAIAAIGLIAFISIAIIVFQRIRNKNLQFKQKQQESNHEIFNLLMTQQGKLEEGKKIEQERISQELHDGVLNRMLGIRLVLIGLNKKTDPDSIEQRSELIKELADLSEEIRTVSHELNNSSYKKFQNFIESIKALIDTFRTATEEIQYNFSFNDDTEWDNFDTKIKINLYRILQECIQNCIKHSNASAINVNFDTTQEEIIVIIKDDGIGFDVKKKKKGIGFKNITSRLKKINGNWHINSNLGNGTSVTLKIPIEQLQKV